MYNTTQTFHKHKDTSLRGHIRIPNAVYFVNQVHISGLPLPSVLTISTSNANTYRASYPGYFREPHWFSMGIQETFRVTWRVCKQCIPRIQSASCQFPLSQWIMVIDIGLSIQQHEYCKIKSYICMYKYPSKCEWNSSNYHLISMLVMIRYITIQGTPIMLPIVLYHTQHHNRLKSARRVRFMMTSSNGNIFRVTGPLCGEFTGHKGQWRRALMFSLVCAWINGWVNSRVRLVRLLDAIAPIVTSL